MAIKIPLTNFVIERRPKAVAEKLPLIKSPMGVGRPDSNMIGFKLSVDIFFTAYRSQADLFSCIREWKENTGTAGFRLFDPKNTDKELNPSLDRDVWEILNFTKPFQTLYKDIIGHLGIAGNAYLAIVKSVSGDKVLGLETIDPRTIAVVTDINGTVYRYIQKVNSNMVVFDASEIIHIQLGKDPRNETFGLSPMETVIWEARTDLNAMITNYSFFENDAQPAVQYIFDEGMTEEEMEKALTVIKDQFSGAKNKHKPIALAGIKEIKTLGISQRDMEFIAGRKFNTEKIAEAYGVPKFMLGFTESVNNNNGVELTRNAYAGTFKPLEVLLDLAITEFLNRIGLTGIVGFATNEQIINMAELEKRGIEEYKSGLITLRQYKVKTNKEITPDDEKNDMIDSYIIHSGSTAVLLEDVGTDPEASEVGQKSVENFINSLEHVGT